MCNGNGVVGVTHDKVRVAAALEGLPVLAHALESGALHWSALRELTRVATADTQREWLEVARGQNVRQLEALVAGASPGDMPSDPHAPRLARHVLRFEVAADTFAVFREAMSHLRRGSAARLDDDAPCVRVAPDIVAMAWCDAQNLGHTQALDSHAKVFSALRHLGFREREVREVMEVLRQTVETRTLGTQPLLREALERLGPPTRGC